MGAGQVQSEAEVLGGVVWGGPKADGRVQGLIYV